MAGDPLGQRPSIALLEPVEFQLIRTGSRLCPGEFWLHLSTQRRGLPKNTDEHIQTGIKILNSVDKECQVNERRPGEYIERKLTGSRQGLSQNSIECIASNAGPPIQGDGAAALI